MGVLSTIKDYGTEILNSIRDNDLKSFKHICEKQLQYDAKIAELCVMDIKHRPTQKFACPLILATRLEDPAIIRYMLEVGVNPNFVHHTAYSTKRKEVLTPLHVAVELGLRRTVELLMRYNADPNVPDHNEDTPFIMAVKKADWVIMKMLLSNGANSMIPDRFGNAPIHIAALYGHLQMVKSLMKQGADLHQKGNQGTIPCHIAAKEGHVHLVQVFCSSDPGLINAKVPCYQDKREKAQMHLACENGHVETVIALLDQFGADVNLTDSQANTPLHCLVLFPYQHLKMRDKDHYYATAKILVKYNAKVNERNKEGNTPLHLAAANNHPKIVELLLNIGANPMTENNERLKAIDMVHASDAVTKQLLKDRMLNPKPVMNVSSLSLIQNSSLHLASPRMDRSSKHNASKNSLVMAKLHTKQNHSRHKPHNLSATSSSSSVFIKDPRKQSSYFSPRMRKELMHTSDDNHHHLPPMHPFPSTLEQSSRPYRTSRRKAHHNTSSSTLTNSLYDEKRYRKYNYSSDETSTTTYEKRRHGSHRRNGSSESRHHGRHRRHKRSYYKDDSDSTLKHRKTPKSKHHSFSSDEGIRVTTYEGKPKTIEVEYEKGPITIELEEEDEVFDDGNKKDKHRKKSKKRPKEGYEKMESRSDTEHRNEELKRFYEKVKGEKKRMKSKKISSESEESVGSSLEEAVVNVEPSKAEVSKKLEKKKKNKNEKSNRQRQYEEQLEMERMPIEDPAPPVENYESGSDYESESMGSDELEDEIKTTQRLLNESATRRISEVVETLRKRWSTDEYESDDKEVAKKDTKKGEEEENDVVKEGKGNLEDKKPEIPREASVEGFSTQMLESSPYQTIKLETLTPPRTNRTPTKEQEPKQQVSVEKETTFGVEASGSLNLRVSGETPKAYSRSDKNTARSQFFHAQPVRIESSSEASDSEATSPASRRRQEWSRPSPPIFPGPPKLPRGPRTEETFEANKDYNHFLKPYKGMGRIEAKTDLIDEALYQEATTTTVTTKTTTLEKQTKILPEQYQIKNNKKEQENKIDSSENNQTNEDDSTSKEDEEKNKERNKRNETKEKKKSPIDSLLESYEKEPSMGIRNKNNNKNNNKYNNNNKNNNKNNNNNNKNNNKDSKYNNNDDDDHNDEAAIVVDLHEFKKEIEREYSESQELEEKKTRDKLTSKNHGGKSNGNVSKDFEAVNDSSLKKMKSKGYRTTGERKNEKFEVSSEEGFSQSDFTSDFDENEKAKKPTRNRKQKKGKSKSEREDDDSTTKKTPGNVNSLDFVNQKKGEISDLDKLGLDIVIPSTIKDNEDTKVPYMKLDSKMYENLTGTKKKENIEKYETETKKQNKTSDYSSQVFKPPKPQLSPIPQRRIIDSNKNVKKSHSHRLKNYNPDDLNYKKYDKKMPTFLPKHPNRPYDVHKMSGFSDTETQSYRRARRRKKAYSEAELSDLEPPDKTNSKLTYRQLALRSLRHETRRNHQSLQPPVSADPSALKHLLTLKKFRKRRRKRGDHTLPSAGWYGHYEMKRVISLQSFSGSEIDLDPDISFISDDEWLSDDLSVSSLSLSKKFENPVYDSLMKYQKLNDSRVEMRDKEYDTMDYLQPPLLHKHDEVAALWMEQLKEGTVHKTTTMCLAVLPPGQPLPPSVQTDHLDQDSQWVAVKSRLRKKKKITSTSISEAQGEVDEAVERPHVVFFKADVGWIKLAWVLFDRLQDDSKTVKMISDVQSGSPDSLSEQLIDMMGRWWSLKGDKATLQELKRSLELAQLCYVEEEMAGNDEEEAEEDEDERMVSHELGHGDSQITRDNHNHITRSSDGTSQYVSGTEKGSEEFGGVRGEESRSLEPYRKEPVERKIKKLKKAKGHYKGRQHHPPEETTFAASDDNSVKKKLKKTLKQETNL